MPIHLSYIPYVPDKSRSRNDYELLRSKARSHAAKFRHRNNANTIVLNKHCWSPPTYPHCLGHRGTPTAPGKQIGWAPSYDGDNLCSHSPRIRIEQLLAEEEQDTKTMSIGRLVAPDNDTNRYKTEPEGPGMDSMARHGKFEQELTSPGPWHWTRGARVDPFDCIPGYDRYGASLAIDFLIHYVMPTVASINEAFNVVNVYGQWVLENMAKYEDFFHVILGLTKVAHTAIACPGSLLPQDAFVHAGQAMSKLRARLAKPNARADDGAILTILYLAMFERGLGNDAAFKAHRAQVDQMVASRGGVDCLGVDSSARATLTVLLSLSGDQPTDSPTSEPATEKLLVIRQAPRFRFEDDVKIIDKLPCGFRNLARAGVLSSETLQIIHRISVKQDWSPQDATYREKQGKERTKVYRPVAGQAWNFWDACTAFRTPDGPGGPSLEKMICLALFRYCANRANRLRPKACIYHSATTQLTARLPAFRVSSARTERDCLIWIWLVAIDSWAMAQNSPELSADGARLLAKMRDALPELRDWAWWDLECLGQKFFWRDDLRVLLRANWDAPGLGEEEY
ncbi:hypothetical protein Z517_10219 [Fonsecaea pedrosoi CBS 271.37]|uniref:Transcription factor domain-containing protein n=1 Tax=Fonsecaea pedrosoi CBS 271.37 TaxID=1442368 RepID=A0A0D2G410_9EURO|nr:uncharacterized protein Z517_10219 [Fonsecaea pedrosoi CBS 271.37]KIW75478.1 hypothetical protein Z517_10219 [Fonsecaea pedrosoi CBS 271.37]